MEHHHTNPTPVHHTQQISASEVNTLTAVSSSSSSSTFLAPTTAASALKRPLEESESERAWKRRRHSVMDEMSLNNSNSMKSRVPSTVEIPPSPTSNEHPTKTTFEQNVNQASTLPKPRARALSEPNHSTIFKSRHFDLNSKRFQTATGCRKGTSSHKTRRSSQDKPPVNLSTLRELDLKEILNNPRLRHDIYFDAALHFRPNLDGQRGQKKRAQANAYWDGIAKECENVRRNQHSLQICPSTRFQSKKLIILFETMRDILLSLVPAKDQKTVEQVFDQSLLMQQLEYGLLDFKRLAEWLARLLKAHCAPMRDSWVDDMVSKIVDGVDTENTRLLVDGLRSVFGILEAMKLDVANHQIRTLRPFLVNSAAEFEREHFQKRIAKGAFAIDESQVWFQDVVSKYTRDDKTQEYQDYLTLGIMDILTPSAAATTGTKPPSTFTFDYERLETIRVDIREDTCMKICLLLFRQLAMSQKCKRDINEQVNTELTSMLQAVIGDDDVSERWDKNVSAVALQIAQFATAFSQNKNTVGVVPSSSMVSMAEQWLSSHTRLESKIYKMVESTITKSIVERTQSILQAWTIHKTPQINLTTSVMGLSADFAAVPQRLAKILNLHWRIFEAMYLSSAQLQQLQRERAASPKAGSALSTRPSSPQTQSEIIHGVSDISLQGVERKDF